MDTEHLRAFVAVARDMRFTTAAKRLGTTQPTLSRRVQQLERELGARLVVRGTSGIVLTDAGTRYLPEAQRALSSLEAGARALGELAGEPRGVVSIGSPRTIGAYIVPPVIALFHQRYPLVRIRLVERLAPELEDRLARGDLDLAVFNLPVRHVDLTAQKLWQEDYVLAVPPSHRFASAPRAISLGEVAGEPLVVIPGLPSTVALEAACAERGVEPHVVVQCETHESVRRMVEQGVGVALLPRLVAKVTARFVAVEIAQGALRRQVALVHRGEAYLSVGARALRAVIVEKLAKRAGKRA